MNNLTQKRLKELFHYDKETGEFSILTTRRPLTKSLNMGYLRTFIDGKRFKLHRLAWLYEYGVMPDKFIDHINGNRSDNRICNLRNVSNAENCLNLKSPRRNNKSGFLGVVKHGKKWQSNITKDGLRIFLGTFDSPQEAYKIYLKEKQKIQGFI